MFRANGIETDHLAKTQSCGELGCPIVEHVSSQLRLTCLLLILGVSCFWVCVIYVDKLALWVFNVGRCFCSVWCFPEHILIPLVHCKSCHVLRVLSCQLFIRIACQCSISTASAGTRVHACMCACLAVWPRRTASEAAAAWARAA